MTGEWLLHEILLIRNVVIRASAYFSLKFNFIVLSTLLFSIHVFAQRSLIQFRIYNAGYVLTPKSWVGMKQDTLFCFGLVLTNTSHKEISIGLYNCDWPRYFEASKNEVKRFGYRCTANYPISINLKPTQSCLNYFFYTKSTPTITQVQMIFEFYNGDDFLGYCQNRDMGLAEGKKLIMPKPLKVFSNTCNIEPRNNIDFFSHGPFQEDMHGVLRFIRYRSDIYGYRLFQNYQRYFAKY